MPDASPQISPLDEGNSTAPVEAKLSPAMRQYQHFKAQHPGYILFFRMGDFYEMFWDDAKTAARVLGLALTSRSKGADSIPMAGVPFHAVEGYLRRMIAAGHKVAICEQTEDAALAKGLVKRDVVRLMTPGTITDDPLLDGRIDNYLAAVAIGGKNRRGLAWVELSTGNCWAMSGDEKQVLEQIARLRPAEVLTPELENGAENPIGNLVRQQNVATVSSRPAWQFTAHHAKQMVLEQWQAATVAGFGFTDDDPAVPAVAAMLSYLRETQRTALYHIRPPRRQTADEHLAIDASTWRSLEIERTVRSGGTEGSLLGAIDRTRTAMGARMLRQWLRSPRRDRAQIVARQTAVAALLDAPAALRAIAAALDDFCDVDRIVGRISVGRATPRDMAGLGRCLAAAPALFDSIEALPNWGDVDVGVAEMPKFCLDRAAQLNAAIKPDPAPHLREGDVIAAGYDPELDRLRELATNSQQWLANYQGTLARESGIASLKVSYNKVFGYYIEVTDSHRAKVPPAWTRRQTVRNAERYITPELKQFEEEALSAKTRSIALEQQLFEKLRQELLPYIGAFQALADGVARLDVLSGLATLALECRYCRPTITDDRRLEIIDGRHPVLDQQLGSQFVANDVKFGLDDSLFLITGPNMAGKSTYIRQVALIVLMAQMGSYVPAASATIGLADRLFARIGASDELHGGQSTFMVEMTETANILNNATDRSLVILDEIGRGTSTLDGLSLAWAIGEHIASEVRCRTLFATHYHELTDLADRFDGVGNLNVAVREWEDQVIFLHRIVEGGTDRSYGIHVARLAGVPQPVLKRARQLLGELAVQHLGRSKIGRGRRGHDERQLSLFADPVQEVAQALGATDATDLTPEAALELVKGLKKKLGK
ncbi:MAG: DNA mismatch repair protein MutS [Tepidisphaeraceae bacterium]